jgi:hypothetical protein
MADKTLLFWRNWVSSDNTYISKYVKASFH